MVQSAQADAPAYRSVAVVALLLAASMGLVVAAFWPGLAGPFVLDDQLHFPKLGHNGQVDHLRSFFQFVFSGGSATGRPLAFLSFLIHDNSWPTDPWPIKHANLMLHVVNGLLIFILVRRLFLMAAPSAPSRPMPIPAADAAALMVAALWTLHPIHISPVMMGVQRMTLMMATFSLLGLIFYLKGRTVAVRRPVAGLAYMSVAVGGFGFLGVLAKEPAVLMVLYILALELTVFSRRDVARPRHLGKWLLVFVGIPVAGLVAYFLLNLERMDDLFAKREFDMTERLLTEARIMLDYVRVIFLPSISASGPYHDDYLISRGLLDPPRTLFALILVLGSLVGALAFRRKWPLLALGILWFLFGHVLESTFLPLELYFEHRNYLPMLGFVMAIAFAVVRLQARVRRYVIYALFVFLALETFVTHNAAKAWGQWEVMANVWAAEHPDSLRAQLGAIRFWLTRERYDVVAAHLDRALTGLPDDAGMRLYGFIIGRCVKGEVDRDAYVEMETLESVVPEASFDHASLDGLRFLVKHSKDGRCRITNDELLHIIDLYLSNWRFREVNSSRAFLYQKRADILIREGNLDGVINSLDEAYRALRRYDIALNQAYLLMTAGLYDEALDYIRKARETPPYNPYVRLWQDDHIGEMERAIEAVRDGATPVFE